MPLTLLSAAHSIARVVMKRVVENARFKLRRVSIILRASSLCLLTSFVAAGVAAEQTPASPATPRFEIPASGLEWRQPAQPLQYFDATGHRAGVFGRQTGQFEAWVYPMKVLHGFRLEFRQEGMIEPVRGETLLHEVIVRPESTTLVYVHPRFTVRETIWVPLDEPGILLTFDVDTDKPLVITAKFVPDFKPMWPAGMGGQHSFWIEEDKAFGLSDGTYKPTAMIGSPAVGGFTEFMDHQLIGGEMVLQLRVQPEQARAALIPLVISLSMESEQKAREVYRSILGRVRELYESRVKYHTDFLARTMALETPDPELNRAFVWAKVAIDAGWVCHPTYGCGLIAGYGPSGDGERPGFAWWFGGDALMSSWAMEDYGDLSGALQVLRFLKARQRADGKMMHEMTQSVDLIDWFGKYPFAYYHADTTPMYLYSIAQYWEHTGDKKFLEEFWPSAKKAYEYCLSTVDPKDGLMDNTKAGLAAVEVGPLRGKVTKDIYLEGFWIGALTAMHEMAQAMSDADLSNAAFAEREKARESLLANWWNPEGKYFAFGVSGDGRRADMVGAWPAVMLALYGGLQLKQDDQQARRLAEPELSTEWGDRWLSEKDSLYDPTSYNNGTVWPFMNSFVSWSEFDYDYPLAGLASLRAGANLTGIQSPGYMPEHMNGDRFLPGERSVPHQLFSSAGVVVPTVRGLFGLEPVRKADEIKLLFRPRLPANWPSVSFKRLAFQGGLLSGELQRSAGRTSLRLDYHGPKPIEVLIEFDLPLGARVTRRLIDGKRYPLLGSNAETAKSGHVGLRLVQQSEIVIEYEDGIGIVPPEINPHPGKTPTALKVLNARESPSAVRQIDLEVAGLGGRTYSLDLVSTLPNVKAEGAAVHKIDGGYRLEISFEGAGYVTRTIKLHY